MEGAAQGRPQQVRRLTGDRDEADPLWLLDLRQAVEQPPSVGVLRTGEELAGGPLLNDPPGVHHRDLVAHLGNHPEVVGDEEHRRAGGALQRAHQLQDLSLDRNVERGRRLVGDQQLRRACQRHRDHRPLPETARELVRIGVGPLLRVRHADGVQQLDRSLAGGPLGEPLVQQQRLGDLVADGEDRVERGQRLLKDHRDVVATDPAHRLLRQREQVAPVEADLAADNLPRR